MPPQKTKTSKLLLFVVLIAIIGLFAINYSSKKDISSDQNQYENQIQNVEDSNDDLGEGVVPKKEIEQKPVVKPNPLVEVSKDVYGRYIAPECKTYSLCNGPIHCGNIDLDESTLSGSCVVLPQFVCYKDSDARCEPQADGNCDWTPSAELNACIENPPEQAE